MIQTSKVSDRRTLSFQSLDDILADAEALAAGDIRTMGNWTSGQIVDHVAALIELSIDGFTMKAPLPLRIFGRLMRNMALNKPMRPGFKMPKKFAAMAPRPDVQWDAALARLRSVGQRVRDGEQMQHPSPMLGRMSHEDWVKLHCRHAELHFSFMHPA